MPNQLNKRQDIAITCSIFWILLHISPFYFALATFQHKSKHTLCCINSDTSEEVSDILAYFCKQKLRRENYLIFYNGL